MNKANIFKNLFLLLLLILVSVLATVFWYKNLIFLTLLCGLAILVIIYNFLLSELRHINKLKLLIEAIGNKDFMFSFKESKKGAIGSVNYYLNLIKSMLSNVRRELEIHEKYYEILLDKVSGGIIVTNQNDSVLIANEAVKKLLSIDMVSHINNLSRYHAGMSEIFRQTEPNSIQIFSFANEYEEVKISIQLSILEYNNNVYKIYTINNIIDELNYNELNSWKKLTSVLTHEIMNSLTPIITISSTLKENIHIKDNEILDSLDIISTTSNHLVEFVENYRKLSRIATPIKLPISVKQLLNNAIGVFDNGKIDNISFSLKITNEDMLIYADESQITQILINLIKNGIESIGDNKGEINIEASINELESITIKVYDSGDKIPNEIAENIFMPFFSTKQRGSGIGLSIARQIMYLHNGTISLHQKTRKCFVLVFK